MTKAVAQPLCVSIPHLLTTLVLVNDRSSSEEGRCAYTLYPAAPRRPTTTSVPPCRSEWTSTLVGAGHDGQSGNALGGRIRLTGRILPRHLTSTLLATPRCPVVLPPSSVPRNLGRAKGSYSSLPLKRLRTWRTGEAQAGWTPSGSKISAWCSDIPAETPAAEARVALTQSWAISPAA